MSGVAQYLIALCNAVQDSYQSSGIAVRIGASDSKLKVEASKNLHSILSFSPAPESVAVEFLNELAKVSGMSHLVEPIVRRAFQFDPTTWATAVMTFLSNNFVTKEERAKKLQPVTNLATETFSRLIIATRNPGGKKTPQESIHPTPDINHRLREIRYLLGEATTKCSQSALKELVFWRDGFNCPFTGVPFARPGSHVTVQTAHILPFSFRDKTR